MSYEFTKQEELIINRVSNKGIIIAFILVIGAIIDILAIIFSDDHSGKAIIYSLQDLTQLGVAAAFFMPFRNFKNIVKTSGNDIEETMTAMERMVLGFKIMLIAMIAVLILDLILFIL